MNNESMNSDTNTSECIQVSKETKKMGIMGIVFGYLGIHDFMNKKPGKGFAHLALTFLPAIIVTCLYVALFFYVFKCGTGDFSSCKTEVDRTIERGLSETVKAFDEYNIYGFIPLSFFGSWIWGIIEGVSLLRLSRKIRFQHPTQEPSSQHISHE